jgi:cell division protease FtsH
MESDSSSRKQTIVIGYIIAAFIGVLALQWVITTCSTVETIPYGEFEQLVDQGKLTEVAIGQDTIQGKLKDSRMENRTRWSAAACEV